MEELKPDFIKNKNEEQIKQLTKSDLDENKDKKPEDKNLEKKEKKEKKEEKEIKERNSKMPSMSVMKTLCHYKMYNNLMSDDYKDFLLNSKRLYFNCPTRQKNTLDKIQKYLNRKMEIGNSVNNNNKTEINNNNKTEINNENKNKITIDKDNRSSVIKSEVDNNVNISLDREEEFNNLSDLSNKRNCVCDCTICSYCSRKDSFILVEELRL